MKMMDRQIFENLKFDLNVLVESDILCKDCNNKLIELLKHHNIKDYR